MILLNLLPDKDIQSRLKTTYYFYICTANYQHEKMRITYSQELQKYNSFSIKAKAQRFIEFETAHDFRKVHEKKELFEIPFYILGGGNNTLFINDYEGNLLKISNKGLKVLEDNKHFRRIEIGAGEDWNDLVHYALNEGLHGLENLIDIPGNVGAAPIQNIGAYGAELADVIEAVRITHIHNGKEELLSKEDCSFSYRSSIFKTQLKNRVLVQSIILCLRKKADLKLSYGSITDTLAQMKIKNPTPRDVAQAVSKIRSSKLPDPRKIGNAGSFFKNPIVSAEHFVKIKEAFPNLISYPMDNDTYKLAAGWLIDQAGWKGKIMGEAAVHDKQALVLVNYRNRATGKEIMELAQAIINDIQKKFGVVLEPEVNVIG